MQKYIITKEEDGVFLCITPGVNPAICFLWDLYITDTGFTYQIDWAVNGRYTNGCRKKMIRRMILSLVRRAINDRR